MIVFGYTNNHYAGHAPTTIRQFRHLWNEKGFPQLAEFKNVVREATLFD